MQETDTLVSWYLRKGVIQASLYTAPTMNDIQIVDPTFVGSNPPCASAYLSQQLQIVDPTFAGSSPPCASAYLPQLPFIEMLAFHIAKDYR